MRTASLLTLLFALLLVLPACDNASSSDTDDDQGPPPPAGLSGTWTGTAEEWWLYGEESLTLELTEQDGQLTGTIRYGSRSDQAIQGTVEGDAFTIQTNVMGDGSNASSTPIEGTVSGFTAGSAMTGTITFNLTVPTQASIPVGFSATKE